MNVTRYTVNKVIVGGARFLSTAMSPLLMPTYGALLVLWTSILCTLPSGTRMTVLAVVLGITGALPVIVIGLLDHYGIITNKRLINRRERLIPYAFSILCYIGATFYLQHIHAPQWFVMFMAGATLACLVSMVVNLWWKISAHMTGIGGIVALLYQIHLQGLSAFDYFWLLSITMLIAGILGSARMIMRRHGLLQVVAGFINGYFCVTLLMKLFG